MTDSQPASAAKSRVLKLRIEGERDFIEADLALDNDLNMRALFDLVTLELEIKPERIKYLRKLPNTKLRRDCEIRRFVDYQEIEAVLFEEN